MTTKIRKKKTYINKIKFKKNIILKKKGTIEAYKRSIKNTYIHITTKYRRRTHSVQDITL